VRAGLRQLVVGLVALPLSVLPFAAYLGLTSEGRLVWARAVVTVAPPRLPTLSDEERRAAVEAAPQYRDAVAVLVYHGVGTGSDGDADRSLTVSPRRFGEHLATLRAAGMHAVTAAEVVAAWRGGKALPPNAVMITFDDGRADAMMFADPLLKQAAMKATMFVITRSAKHHGIYYASWDRLASASRSGRWDIESHTSALHHEQRVARGGSLPAMTSLAPGETVSEFRGRIRRDLAEAADAIEAETGRAPVAFAYPFGAYGADRTNDPAVRAIVRDEVRRRYVLAFEQDDQGSMRLVTRSDPRHALRRLEVGDWSAAELLGRIRAAAARTHEGARSS
jgi:peptidoglycan/xylan/chitin deacetylase (PgdA/CDA1 family)